LDFMDDIVNKIEELEARVNHLRGRL
jgi:hypothetical protein